MNQTPFYNVSFRRAVSICALAALLAGCRMPGRAASPTDGGDTPAPPAASAPASGETSAAETATPPPATPTIQPWAARVNGWVIPLSVYEAGLAQFGQAHSAEPSPEGRQRVLDDLIDQALLAQAGEAQGYAVSEADVQHSLDDLQQRMGGEPALADWTRAQGYTAASFRQALHLSLAAARMRDAIAAQTPVSAEQVHARQILLYNEATANEVLQLLQNGNSFDNLAIKYDPLTGGDLGWFPKGYLLDPALEEAVFALQAGQTTGVIKTLAGYHIVQLIERDAQRLLLPDALAKAQQQAVVQWLQDARAAAQIEVNP